jgi:hypothetical protein
MASIVTYKNDGSRCFCQLRFESGERVLISIAGHPHPSIKILRVALGGLLPRETIWELDSVRLGGSESMARRVIASFLSDSDTLAHPLDAIRDSLLPCRSIQEALAVLKEKEGHASTEFTLQLHKVPRGSSRKGIEDRVAASLWRCAGHHHR